MGIATPMPAEVTGSIGPPPAQGPARVVKYAKPVKVGFGLLWQAIRLPRTKARFYDRLNAALNSYARVTRLTLASCLLTIDIPVLWT